MSGSSISSVAAVLDLYDRLGDEPYGEEVSQTAHALQCAAHARAAGASEPLVAAALLHDVGHLVVDVRAAGADDRHEAIGARTLGAMFGPEVVAPVALHVVAKRWRCAVDPDYVAALSGASLASLIAQGGPLDEPARARFEANASFDGAVALRTWDDLAKDPGIATGSIHDFEELLASLARASAA